MARIRTIKPEFPQSESMGRVSRESRLCFVLLWTIADDEGRLRGNSRMLASLLYPYDDDARKHIDSWLDELSTEGCLDRYTADGQQYIQIRNWLIHQKIDRPSKSKFPALASTREDSRELDEPSSLEGKGSKDQGRDQGMEGKGESAAPQSDAAPAFILPVAGGKEFPVSQEQVEGWQRDFPGVDVCQQLRCMRAWCDANPTRQKTARGVPAFVVRWLSKEQDRGRPSTAPPQETAHQRAMRERWEAVRGTPAGKVIDITPHPVHLALGVA